VLRINSGSSLEGYFSPFLLGFEDVLFFVPRLPTTLFVCFRLKKNGVADALCVLKRRRRKALKKLMTRNMRYLAKSLCVAGRKKQKKENEVSGVHEGQGP